MSRKYNKKGETALLDDDSQSTQPSSSRRSGGAAGRSTKRQQPREEVVAPPPPEVEDEEDEEPKGFFSSKTNIIGAVVSVLVILAIIAGVAWFLLSENPDTPNGGYVSEWGNVLLSNVNRTAIQYNFDSVTGYTTLSGTIPSLQAVDFVHSSFLASFAANSTIATSTVHTYYALFNYPRGYDPNATNPDASAAMNSRRLAMLLNGTRTNASLAEAVIDMDPATKRNDAVPTFNGYSPSTNGNLLAPVFFVNYGTLDDYRLLDRYNFNMTGKIAIARYGNNFRGMKAAIGAKFGCVGVLIYSDPADDGDTLGPVYGSAPPGGPFRPSSGVQRGSAEDISLFAGDPMTPRVAHLTADQATTYSMSNSPVLPTIPVHPISYGDAAMFLSAMTGVSVSDPGIPFPDSWKTGGLFGANQHIGLLSNYSSTLNNDTISYMPVQAELFLDLPFAVRPISDVVATIIGSDYPDEWVILGNHRDAWVYGGVDPHQGTAVLVELARVFGVMLSQGWQPKRSIKLCSWDAEEQALIGSTEWVEDMVANQQLQSKAVVYINVDVAVEAWPKADSNPVLPIIDVGAVPSLGAIAVQIANSVADPWRTTSSTNVSLLSSWQQYGVNGANVSDLGSGSDYSAFLQFAGIPSLSLEFGPGKGDKAPYGVYHSVYDSDMYDHMYMDPDNNGKYAMAQYWGLLALNLTDSLVLPFHYSDYADRISGHLVEIQQYANTLTSCIGALDFQPLQLALSNFTTAAVALDQQLAGLNASATLNSTAVVALNRLLVSTEQSFLAVDDLFPGRPYLWYRHVLVAPGLWAGYDSEAFPAVHDAIEGEIGTGRWQCTAPDVRKQNATDQINNAARAINSATVKLNAAYALTTSGPPPPPPIELSSSSSSSAGAFSSSSESAVSSSSSVSSSSVSSSSSASSSSSSSSSSQNQSLAVTSSSSSSSFPSSSSSSSSSSLAPSSSSSSSHPSSSSSSSYSSSSSSSSSSSNNTTASYGSVSRRSGAKAVRGEHFLDVARVLREEDDSNQ